MYISYTLGPQLKNLNADFPLANCFIGSVKLTTNTDLYKYKYSGYSIGFDCRSEFLFTEGSYGKNVNLFGADMSSPVPVDNKGPTQGLDDTALTVGAKYPINFKQ